jgi:hypothetical protein
MKGTGPTGDLPQRAATLIVVKCSGVCSLVSEAGSVDYSPLFLGSGSIPAGESSKGLLVFIYRIEAKAVARSSVLAGKLHNMTARIT